MVLMPIAASHFDGDTIAVPTSKASATPLPPTIPTLVAVVEEHPCLRGD